MTLFHSVILGIIEGITEFLPISSTGHLILASLLLKLSQNDFQKFFEVFIQSGAIMAVIFIYLRLILSNKLLIKKIIFSFIPTAVIGFLLYKTIKNIFFESYNLIFFSLISVGLIFLLTEFLIKKQKLFLQKSIKDMTITEAIIIGINQALSVVPGVSRSGIVIVAMMIMGYRREEAAEYSFLLAVPTILAASGLDLLKTNFQLILGDGHLLILSLGLITSFITAYFSIKWLIAYLKKNSLVLFGIYRIILAIILLQIIK
ncbi:MAG: undecaprenyl-diphosphate phosphatase [Microgenomates group bacterium]|nr:undecaprenyl-diphosphate phosphatase [Microgenomates group bacterium]